MNRGPIWTAVVLGATACSMASGAWAAGFAVRENCTEGIGTIFAGGGSLADGPCTVFNNPAGMTRLTGDQVEFDATPTFYSLSFHGSDSAGGIDGNNGAKPTAVPAFYGVLDLTPDLKAGLAITAPFGLPLKYTSAWSGRYLDIESQALSADINPNLAYKITDRLSVAGGLSVQYFTFTLVQAIDQSAILGAPVQDGNIRFKGHDWAVGYNFGLLYELDPDTRIGLTYRSKMTHHLKGVQELSAIAPPLAGFLPSSRAMVSFNDPATTGISVTHALTPEWTLASDIQWTQWSTFKTLTITATPTTSALYNESYRDSWFTSIGVIYHPEGLWTWRGGFGWDQSPVVNRYRDAAVPDQDRYMLGVGAGYQWSPNLTVNAAYAHYFAPNASMNDSINNVDPNTGTKLSGTYQLSADYISASVRYQF
jgi:long-chain fatty acid transport protein